MVELLALAGQTSDLEAGVHRQAAELAKAGRFATALHVAARARDAMAMSAPAMFSSYRPHLAEETPARSSPRMEALQKQVADLEASVQLLQRSGSPCREPAPRECQAPESASPEKPPARAPAKQGASTPGATTVEVQQGRRSRRPSTAAVTASLADAASKVGGRRRRRAAEAASKAWTAAIPSRPKRPRTPRAQPRGRKGDETSPAKPKCLSPTKGAQAAEGTARACSPVPQRWSPLPPGKPLPRLPEKASGVSDVSGPARHRGEAGLGDGLFAESQAWGPVVCTGSGGGRARAPRRLPWPQSQPTVYTDAGDSDSDGTVCVCRG